MFQGRAAFGFSALQQIMGAKQPRCGELQIHAEEFSYAMNICWPSRIQPCSRNPGSLARTSSTSCTLILLLLILVGLLLSRESSAKSERSVSRHVPEGYEDESGFHGQSVSGYEI